jgi:hypothetical protein
MGGNTLQRTIESARRFAVGMLPAGDVNVIETAA